MLGFRFLGLSALLAAGVILLGDSSAEARWGSWGSYGSSGGSWGSHGSSGGSSGSRGSWGSSGSHGSWGSSGSRGSWGSSGSSGSYGSHGGHFRRWHHRKHYRRWHSSGSWGSYGSSGGSYGSSGSHGSSGGSYRVITPEESTQADEAPANGGAAAEEVTYRIDASSVLFTVNVPADAKVFINGNETKSSGARRTYVSRGLEADQRYKYEVKAEIQRDGKTVSDTKVVLVSGGDRTPIRFNFGLKPVDKVATAPATITSTATQSPSLVKTTLRLHVPAEAKVYLTGAKTNSSGALRVFSSTRLAAGQNWEGYTIRAELGEGDQQQVREVTTSLTGGQTREITIDFSEKQVARISGAK